jgi:hypothetical protein
MSRKPIQVDDRANEIIRLEAIRQSMKEGQVVTMGQVVAVYAEKLNKKHKLLKNKKEKYYDYK